MGRYRQMFYNILYAFTAQGISLLVSITMSLIVPKVLGVQEFGYWQLFLFYASYLGFFHLGLNDGLYLRLGGKEYKDLNFSQISMQLRISFIFQCIISLLIIISSLIFTNDWNRQVILIGTAIYLPIFNATAFIGYISQAVDRIKLYSKTLTIDKSFFFIGIIILLFIKCDSFKLFMIIYIMGTFISLIYIARNSKEIVFTKAIPSKKDFKEIYVNISIGIKLMISNISSMLIIGISRFVVDKVWGISQFGKFSFSISLTSVFLLFIGQMSIVLFPMLRKTDENNLKNFYNFSRDLLGILFSGVLLGYMPMKYLLGLWLPQYKESLQYLALLLPICTYDGKMNMIYSTYFKVLRKEKFLLQINIASVAISLLLSFAGAYILNNIYFVIISMVIVVAFRSIVSELYLTRLLNVTITKKLILESLLVVIFIMCTWLMGSLVGFLIYIFSYAIYLVILKNDVVAVLHTAKSYLKRST